MIATPKLNNPWYHPYSFQAYGLTWKFEYWEFGAKRTISTSEMVLDVPVAAITRFNTPLDWLADWAKKKRNKVTLEKLTVSAKEPELDFTKGYEKQLDEGEKLKQGDKSGDRTLKPHPVGMTNIDPSCTTHESDETPPVLKSASSNQIPIEYLSLNEIRRDGGTQPRAKIDLAHIKRLEEQIEDSHELEPVTIFYDGESYWLADGFHRWHAHDNQEQKVIAAYIYQGSRRDAVLYSVGANADHKPALPRAREDKRRAVVTLLQDPEWSQWSDRSIAQHCKVHHNTVGKIRASLTGELSSEERTYKTKHGTVATMNTANIGSHYGAECQNAFQLEATSSWVGSLGVSRHSLQQGEPPQRGGSPSRVNGRSMALEELPESERGIVTEAAVTELEGQEEQSELEYSRLPRQNLLDATKSSSVAPQKVEVNTNDILVAFISNLDCMSEAQVEAALRAITQSRPDLIRRVLDGRSDREYGGN